MPKLNIVPTVGTSMLRSSLLRRAAAVGMACVLSLVSNHAHAAGTTYSWNTGSSTWNTNANWTPSGGTGTTYPGSADTATFATTTGNYTVYLNGNEAANVLNFTNTNATTLLGGTSGTAAANTLTLANTGAGITVASGAGAVTIGDTSSSAPAAVNITLGTSQSFTNSSSNLLTVANGITTGTSTPQTLTIAGTGNQAYLGALTNGGGALAVTISDTGTVTLAGNNSGATGAFNWTGGTTGGAKLVLQNNQAFGSTSNTIALSNATAYSTLDLETDSSDTFGYNITGDSGGGSTMNIVSDRLTAGAGVTHTLGGISGDTGSSVLTLTQAGSNVTSGTAGLSFAATTFGQATGNANGSVFNAIGVADTFASLAPTTLTGSANKTTLLILAASGTGLTGSSTGSITVTGAISDSTAGGFTDVTSLSVAGSGNFTLQGTDSYSGATSLYGGTLTLDYTAGNAQKLSSAAVLNLDGGALVLKNGSYAQSVASTTLTQGGNSITQSGGSSTIALGALTTTGGALNVQSGVATTTTATGSNGILANSARYTVNGTDWAVSGTTGTNSITAYSGYTTFVGSGGTNTVNYSLSGIGTVSSTESLGTLKINTTTTGQSLSLGATTLTLSQNGLLFVGSNAYTISGSTGSLASAGTEIIQDWGSGTLTISANRTGNNATEKYGTGALILTGANSSTNSTALTIGGGSVQVNSNSALGAVGTGAGVTLDGGTLIGDTTGGSFALDNSGANQRAITLKQAGGGIDVVGGNTLTVSGVISGSAIGNYQNGILTLGSSSSNGTIDLTGANTYKGGTILAGGTVELGVAENAGTSGPLGLYNPTLFSAYANYNYITFAGGTMEFTSANTYDYSSRFAQVANQSFNINTNGQTVTFATGLAGANSTLTLTGGGSLTLSGASTYTGATTISAGTLALGANNAIGSGSSVVVSGGTFSVGAFNDSLGGLQLTNGQSITGTGVLSSATAYDMESGSVSAILGGSSGLNKTTAGTVTLTGANTYTGTTSVSAGTLTVGATNGIGSSSNVAVSGGTLGFSSFSDNIHGLQVTGGGSVTGSTGVVTSATAYDMQSGSVSAILAGSVGLNKTTSGTVSLTGANTYTGVSSITAGTLVAGNNSALGTNSATVNGATLQVDGSGLNLDNTIYLSGAGVSSVGGIYNTTGSNTLSGSIFATNNTATIAAAASTTLTLSGTITAGANDGITDHVLTFNTPTSGAINVTGTLTDNGATGGGVVVNGGLVTFSNSSNSYSENTTVSSGTLVVTNSGGSATGSGTFTLAAGATLAGTGAINSSGFTIGTASSPVATVLVGQLSASDNNTTQTLTLTDAGGSTITNTNLVFNLNSMTNTGSTAGNQLNLGSTSDITFSNSTLTLNLTGASLVAADTSYVLITDSNGFNPSTDGLTITNGVITGGLSIASNAFFGTPTNGYTTGFYNGSYLYVSGDNIDVMVVPEPSTWAMMIGGLALLILVQRRRNS